MAQNDHSPRPTRNRLRRAQTGFVSKREHVAPPGIAKEILAPPYRCSGA
jgi:hypothetical protein